MTLLKGPLFPSTKKGDVKCQLDLKCCSRQLDWRIEAQSCLLYSCFLSTQHHGKLSEIPGPLSASLVHNEQMCVG
ncbi:hypothetical protein Y1Q_0014767 [Alligator mississippiensis]|uniref:Uncharacterized protein n=1 Tax=Alligator mississippiensis TaxID=8496 RepID=A0A151M1V4_ALLMI|nr:hypothetical protein Y1Q_0014767 [Alligator mississippiensis]